MPADRSRLVLVSLLSAMIAVSSVAAVAESDDSDHELARRLVESGRIKPLDQVLARVAAGHPGDVVSVELDENNGRWIYEIEIIERDGRKTELEIDASSLRILGQDGDD